MKNVHVEVEKSIKNVVESNQSIDKKIIKQYNFNVPLAQRIEHTYYKGKYKGSTPLRDVFFDKSTNNILS